MAEYFMHRGNDLEATEDWNKREAVIMWMCVHVTGGGWKEERRLNESGEVRDQKYLWKNLYLLPWPHDCGVMERSCFYTRRLKWKSLFPMRVLENNWNGQGSSTMWRVRGNKSQKNTEEKGEDEERVDGCLWGDVQGLQRTEAWREWLAPVFQPLRDSPMASDPGPKEGEWGGRVAGPFGLHLEPEEILNCSCCSGTNLCKAARMSSGHNCLRESKYMWQLSPKVAARSQVKQLGIGKLPVAKRPGNQGLCAAVWLWQFFSLTWHLPSSHVPKKKIKK